MLLHIIPLIILAGSTLLILMAIAVKRNHFITCLLSGTTLLVAAFSLKCIPSGVSHVGSLFVVDGFGRLFILLILLASLAIVIISYGYLNKIQENKEEYYVAMLTGTLGSSVLAIASHFISFFLGLELLSLSLFILIAYTRTVEKGIEAAIKYLILAGVSSSFLLMGMAMIYSQTGALDFNGIALKLSETGISRPLTLMGLVLMLTGAGFKLAVVPFHLWTPDVYEGAPAPTTAFIASVSKGGMLAILVRFFSIEPGLYFQSMVVIISIIAILSMLIGNLLALRQNNVKRILAYSSIAHFGYILVGFVVGGEQGIEAIIFYIITYSISIIGAFGIVSLLSTRQTEPYNLEEYRGLFWQKPWTAAFFTVILLSLAGMPLTAGFIGKLYILIAGLAKNFLVLSLALVAGSVIGLYYYLRIIVEMLKQPAKSPAETRFSASTCAVLLILVILLIWLGINPGILSELINVVPFVSVQIQPFFH